jgi:hypothetical protein
MDKVIFQYVKEKKNNQHRIIGVVAAAVVNDVQVGVGWSRCAVNKGDVFDKQRGKMIAIGRAVHFGGTDAPPADMLPHIDYFAGRASKYFKNHAVIYPNLPLA